MKMFWVVVTENANNPDKGYTAILHGPELVLAKDQDSAKNRALLEKKFTYQNIDNIEVHLRPFLTGPCIKGSIWRDEGVVYGYDATRVSTALRGAEGPAWLKNHVAYVDSAFAGAFVQAEQLANKLSTTTHGDRP